jgi:signal transduction histidine kinase
MTAHRELRAADATPMEHLHPSGGPATETNDAAFRTIVSTIADGVVIVDTDGVTRYANPAAEQIFGRAADELIGEEFGFPVASLESTEVEVLSRTRGPVIAEMRVTDTTWDGRPARLAAIRDVTERRRAEERERELVREQALRAAAEDGERRAHFLGAAAGILAASLDFRPALTNLAELATPFLADWCIVDLLEENGTFSRAAVASSSPRAHTLVRRLREVRPAADSSGGVSRVLRAATPQLAASIAAAAARGVLGLSADDPAVRDAGLGACMLLPLVMHDRPLGVLTLIDAESGRIFDDDDLDLARELAARAAAAIERGRLYAQAQKANQAKADFLAVMSHELRTPLNAIIGYSDLLMMGVPEPVSDRAGEQVRRIRISARHLLGLIEEILTFSRIEAGREELHVEETCLDELLEDVRILIEPAAAEKMLEFHCRISHGHVRFRSDPQKVRQVLINLLANAVKFTEAGSVSVDARIQDDRACIDVSDTGRGISEADMPRVFDPFWQAEQSRTRHAEGTGLGLAVARRLAHLVAGDITVRSVLGDGSTFSLQLPLRLPRHLG